MSVFILTSSLQLLQAETDFLANEIQKKREKENREIEEQRLKKMVNCLFMLEL